MAIRRWCPFFLATHRHSSKDGQSLETADWHKIIAWQRLADIAMQYVKKGSLAYVSGSLVYRVWVDQAAKKHYAPEIIADRILVLDTKLEAGHVDDTVY